MADSFERILDECIDRINRGDSLEACLSDNPAYAEQLRPLLRAALGTKAAYAFEPSASAREAARRRFDAALAQRREERRVKQPFLGGIFARPVTWGAVAAVVLLLVGAYLGVRFMLTGGSVGPGQVSPPPGQTTPPNPQTPTPVSPTTPIVVAALPNPSGNFVFLMSDDVNAIADFQSVNVTISKVSLLSDNDSERVVEFEPQIKEVDLTQLPGEKTQEIWRGDIPEGHYNKVILHVESVKGVLKATGETVEIKLPSEKIQISIPFEISQGTVTSFTYDLTVIAAGNAQNGAKYILKPQVEESGATQRPVEPEPSGTGQGKEKGKRP